MFSCETVVTEAHFLLRRRTHDGSARLNVLLSSGQINLDFNAIDHIHGIGDMKARCIDIPMSFADACLVRMEESYQARVFTTDGGFRTYRTSSGKRILLLIP